MEIRREGRLVPGLWQRPNKWNLFIFFLQRTAKQNGEITGFTVRKTQVRTEFTFIHSTNAYSKPTLNHRPVDVLESRGAKEHRQLLLPGSPAWRLRTSQLRSPPSPMQASCTSASSSVTRGKQGLYRTKQSSRHRSKCTLLTHRCYLSF